MTLQAALAFLGRARHDEELRAQIKSLGNDATYEALVAIGATAGFDFTADELAGAHARLGTAQGALQPLDLLTLRK